MKKIVFAICFSITSICVFAQHEGGREPAGASRSPAGERSGREGAGNGSGSRGEGKDKAGKGSVSNEAKAAAENIKSANSADGKGQYMSGTQKTEAARQLGNEATRSRANGKTADAKFFEGEKAKLKK